MATRAYWCFISYRHADNKEEGRQWATWLHQALEAYEVPDRLVGTRNDRGELIPERIFPVFRDEEELATGDLTRRIYDALDHTQVLIVLCSPRAIKSEHVAKEILYFKGQDRIANREVIHAAIVAGDPCATDDSADCCIPEALRYEMQGGAAVKNRDVSLLMADFRLADGTEGWTTPQAYRSAIENGPTSLPKREIERLVATYRDRLNQQKLKLIAGILGVPYGSLQERDKAHALKVAEARAKSLRRWLTAVTGVLLVAIALGVYGYLQDQARSIADTEKLEALKGQQRSDYEKLEALRGRQRADEQALRSDRIAAARQQLELARAVGDDDPLAAIKKGLLALTSLDITDPTGTDSAYESLGDLIKSGRVGRIGRNTKAVYPTLDGKSLLVHHGDDVAEVISLADLRTIRSWKGITQISAPWGPDANWRSFNGRQIIDMRDGSLGVRPFFAMSRILAPPANSFWQPLARYNRAGGQCSLGFAECFITSVNDGDEWAAVDLYVERLDLRTGKISRIGDVYELAVSPSSRVPCQVTREDPGWFLTTAAGRVPIGRTYDVKSTSFSSNGQFALVVGDSEISIHSCIGGRLLFTRAADKPARAAFSADGDHLLIQAGGHLEAVNISEEHVLARLANEGEAASGISIELNSPSSWKLKRSSNSELIAYRHGKLWAHLAAVNRTGHLAAVANASGAFINLETGKQYQVGGTGYVFSENPEATVFVTFHETETKGEHPQKVIDRIILRDVQSPDRVLATIARQSQRQLDMSAATMGQSAGLFYVALYAKETREDPPFTTIFSHETILFDVRTAKAFKTLPFRVDEASRSRDRTQSLVVLRGSTDKRDDLFSVVRAKDNTVIWVSDLDGSQLVGFHVAETTDPRLFVVQYKTAVGAIHRVIDGKLVAKLSGVLTRVEFSEDGRFITAWYTDGRCELLSVTDLEVTVLAQLGLIVANVQVLRGGHEVVVRHDDGRTYLLNMDWLGRVVKASLSVRQLVGEIRDKGAGPAAVPWWSAEHPSHHPWSKQASGAKP
ncbi:TIR domain-containing protein [Paucibacter sp. B51]|uniref:TIR domain-containing protein n=1 Tax=Paucibacter sp. B51 TaxID=2993315 RepID=UPI0022EBC018|nr:TIR domain-containing protein [Paucibacter sp. B51]